MIYAVRILSELDRRLDQTVELTLYGRAAFQLGFESPPEEFSQSLDVDVVLWIGQAEELQRSTNFWEALEETNEALAPTGFFMSHLFVEDQLVLTPGWRRNRKKIQADWPHLDLYRLGDADLLLSKLMRDDPQDRNDALFIVRRRGWDRSNLLKLIDEARLPDIPEVQEQFGVASGKLLVAVDAL